MIIRDSIHSVKMKKKKIKSSPSRKSKSESAVLNEIALFYAKNPSKPMGLSAVLSKINTSTPGIINQCLDALEQKKIITKITPGKWIYTGPKINTDSNKNKIATIEGTVDMARSGAAYILVKGMSKDVFVSAPNLKSAQDGDYVEIKLNNASGRRPEGVVTKILHRSKTQFVGIYREFKNQTYVIVKNRRQELEIYIAQENKIILTDFDRVVVEVVQWKQKSSDRLYGIITQNLGRESSIDIEMKTIIADQGFSLEFPYHVLQEVKHIDEKINDITDRIDYRQICTFTIDPIDAKDFDDALSIRRNEYNDLEIGVHIADVSYYVARDSALDKEALKRGNSVYLVDRVLPMLPERLSNELCSLRANEDKACFSAIFTFDTDNNVKSHWIGRTIIHSQRRFAYEEVQQILDAGAGELFDELFVLNNLAKKIRKERLLNGAIDFESEEVRFRLDEDHKPLELYVKTRLDAHMLIEEFMLLANKYVATFIAKKKTAIPIPFVYRIHDLPDVDKLEEFSEFAAEMGVHLDFQNPKRVAKSMNILADKARQDSTLKVLQSLAIRTMAKAAYSPDNIGHYGLAFDYYTHFTSPIRRYSDLLVHRILDDIIYDRKSYARDILDRQCLYISSQERKAMIAERESTKYYQVLFLKDQIGREFDALVTGMNDRGIYVEMIENKCEAMVPIEMLGDKVNLSKSRLSIQLNQNQTKIKMGDKLRIRLTATDLDDKEVIAALV